MTAEQNRLNEIEKISDQIPQHLLNMAYNDPSITAEQLAYMALKEEAEKRVLANQLGAAMNRNR